MFLEAFLKKSFEDRLFIMSFHCYDYDYNYGLSIIKCLFLILSTFSTYLMKNDWMQGKAQKRQTSLFLFSVNRVYFPVANLLLQITTHLDSQFAAIQQYD